MKRAKSMPDNVDDSQASRGLSKHRQLSGPTEEDNDVGAGGAAGRLPGKLLLALAVPFVPVYVYALYHLFAGVLLAAYLSCLVVYFVAVGAVVASEISICPPWYVHSTPRQGLTRHDLPDYWQGIVTDPHTEFGYAYEEVEFVNDAGMTLRGWWIPGQGERWGDTAGTVLFRCTCFSHSFLQWCSATGVGGTGGRGCGICRCFRPWACRVCCSTCASTASRTGPDEASRTASRSSTTWWPPPSTHCAAR
jgi:hypothetical protein